MGNVITFKELSTPDLLQTNELYDKIYLNKYRKNHNWKFIAPKPI